LLNRGTSAEEGVSGTGVIVGPNQQTLTWSLKRGRKKKTKLASLRSDGGRNPSDRVAAFLRIRWPFSAEYAACRRARLPAVFHIHMYIPHGGAGFPHRSRCRGEDPSASGASNGSAASVTGAVVGAADGIFA